MAEISLLNPQNSKAVFKSLTKESINDLSLDFICKALTKSEYEQNVIMKIMTEITDDAETVKYRGGQQALKLLRVSLKDYLPMLVWLVG